jgi:hypothetical protein
MADKTPEQILKETAEITESLKDAFRSLGASIKENINENLAGANEYTKQYIKSLRGDVSNTLSSLGKKSEKLIENQNKLNKGQLSSKDIAKQLAELENKRLTAANNLISASKNNLMSVKESKKLYLDIKSRIDETNDELKEQLKLAERIEGAMGNLGNIVKGLNKIPILGNLINSEKVIEKMQEAAAKTGSKSSVMAAGFKEIGKSVKEGLLDPLTLSIFFLNQALKANKQIVELGKALGKDSYTYRQNLASAARSSSNLNVTTENLVGAFNEISQSTGYTYEYTTDQLETQIKLTKQVGLQADEAAQIQRYSVLNNQTSEKTYSSFVKGLVSARNQLRVGIDFKATLAEAVKVSGQLAANLGYNPERIAKAVVTAKAFGMTLEQVAKSGEALLNWESSIDNELKAELLTGKQLNLEKARYAALTGDQITLAEELANQVGSAADFTKMNVLQQKALAESVGMTADELSNTLRKREEAIKSGKSLAQITEDEAKEAIERQNIQDKFNAAILKLQDLVGNLVAGPFGQLLDILAKSLNIISSILSNSLVLGAVLGGVVGANLLKMIGYFKQMKKLSIATAITDIVSAAFKSLGPLPIVGMALAGAAAGAGIAYLMSQSSKSGPEFAEGGIITSEINNATIGEAGPEAIIPLNSPKAAGMLGGNVDLTPMIAAINEVRASVDRLYNKNTTINMDSKQVGSTLVQSSYKLA